MLSRLFDAVVTRSPQQRIRAAKVSRAFFRFLPFLGFSPNLGCTDRSPPAAHLFSQDIRALVEAEVREMTSETAAKFINEITSRVFDLINQPDVNDKLGGRTMTSNSSLSRCCDGGRVPCAYVCVCVRARLGLADRAFFAPTFSSLARYCPRNQCRCCGNRRADRV